MMKRLMTIVAMLMTMMSVMAQETVQTTKEFGVNTGVGYTPNALNDSVIVSPLTDQLILPTLTEYGTMPTLRWRPFMWGGLHSWDVHEGLNMSLGMSVFSTFGSGNTYKGAGFGQNVALMYAKPLTDKLSIAVGGYVGNVTWAHNSYMDAGLSAVLGYRFDEHWSAYLYGQKSFMPENRMPYTLHDMSQLGDRIGAAVRYDFNPSFSIQINVEAERTNYGPLKLRRLDPASEQHP